MKRTIFLKLFGGYAVIVLLAAGLIFLLSSASIRKSYEDTSARNLESLGRAIQPDVESYLDAGRTADLDAFVKQTEKRAGARITVIDPQGAVLADSEKDPASMENHRYRPEVADTLEGRVGESLRFSYTVEARMMYIGIPLMKAGTVRAVLRLSYFMSAIDILVSRLRAAIGRAVLIVAVLALLAALLFSLHWSGPIRKLTGAARQVEGGNFRARVHIRNRDELKALADGFNLMTERIERLFADVTAQRENLLNTIASIEEGLAVVDKEGKITLANVSFLRLVGEKTVEGRYFWEVLRRPALRDLIAQVRSGKEGARQECRLDGRPFLCNLSYLPAQDGVVLILHDLTEMRKVEDIKKDFVINASHELRTPISAITGAVEIMADAADEEARAAAVDILKRHAERLTGIVEDLLKLGELEDKAFKLEIKDIDGPALTAGVLRVFEPKAKAKNLVLRLEPAPNLPLLRGDGDQIERLLFNLVDNAVKYTEKGSVTVALKAEGPDFVIEVADTGPGIPPEHRSRIFERFYVADKSRSRKLGGTGLGLSIVKHIVQLHGGTITLDSVEGRGTTFTVRLPLEPPRPVQP
jgi:two-component system, OmpR family, phosphate regulon sensor histidine kinase PhoR